MSYSALSNEEISSYISKHSLLSKSFGGCFPKDQLSKKTVAYQFYILNLDSSDGPGTHWVLLFVNSKHVIYFDPFGSPPSRMIDVFVYPVTKKGIPYLTSDDSIQDTKSQMCGYYCIYMAEQLLKDRSLKDILMNDFSSNRRDSDQKMMSMFKNKLK